MSQAYSLYGLLSIEKIYLLDKLPNSIHQESHLLTDLIGTTMNEYSGRALPRETLQEFEPTHSRISLLPIHLSAYQPLLLPTFRPICLYQLLHEWLTRYS